MTAGYHVKGGLRARVAFHESTRGLGTIALWVTGGDYTVEQDGKVAPVGRDEVAARRAFERAVEMHYQCPECEEVTLGRTHVCAARD